MAAGGTAFAVRADVRKMDQVEAMARTVATKLGPIDTRVLNASISFPVVPFLKFPWEDFQEKLLGEMKAAFFCCKAVVPSMVERKNGCIIGISSGLSRVPGEGFCAHSTAKSGLDAFMKSLALELGPKGIRVNVVAPGLTQTDATAFLSQKEKDASAHMTPLKRIGLPEDVAGAVLFLASGEARFISGTYLPVKRRDPHDLNPVARSARRFFRNGSGRPPGPLTYAGGRGIRKRAWERLLSEEVRP